MRYVLGIETSCDDTSVAILDEKRTILANQISSQFKEHAPYQGVVPELASRTHLTNMPVVFQSALAQANVDAGDISAVAVTMGPGLIGSLLVGINFGKAFAAARNIPLVGVNHIRGHMAALFLEYPHQIPLPALALIVSGGHTHLLLVDEARELILLTKTRDDAAGEAFDKLSKMLGLGFPGGPVIDKLARDGNPKAFPFNMPKFSDGSRDYSFSGLKTAARQKLERDPSAFADRQSQATKDLCASFQAAVVKHLLSRVTLGIQAHPAKALLLGGGVACNSGLRRAFTELGQQHGLPTFITSPLLSTDNAAMIAAEGWDLLDAGARHGLDLAPDIRLKPYSRVDLL